jgi:hypothetical protein
MAQPQQCAWRTDREQQDFMLQFFRNIFKTKLGLLLTFGLLALIALAFATADVANTGTFGGVAGGDRVAVVGDEKIATADLARAATQALDRARQQNPTLSIQSFIAQGGLEETLEQMIDRVAIAEYARQHGFRAGDNLINSELRTIGAFRGPDGNFSPEVYKNALAAQGLTDKLVREDLRKGLLAQLLLEPAAIGVRYPAAAQRVLARVEGGLPLPAALADERGGLPAPEAVNLSREELAQRRERVPPPLALLFSMAQGSAKRLEAPRNAGWYVVDLDRIELGTLAPGDPLALQARRELAQAFAGELTQQAVAAIRREVGVEINRAAVAAVRRQLTGGG